jgi:excisionase family DNA binding protein
MEERDSWPTKLDVTRETGISERTIERLIQRGEIRRELRHVPGRKPISILHPDDVVKLRAETLKPVPVPKTELVKRENADTFPLTAFLAQFQNIKLTEKLYLTVKEASQFSGLPESYLRRQIKAGGIPAVRIGGYRIKRDDLVRYDAATGGVTA